MKPNRRPSWMILMTLAIALSPFAHQLAYANANGDSKSLQPSTISARQQRAPADTTQLQAIAHTLTEKAEVRAQELKRTARHPWNGEQLANLMEIGKPKKAPPPPIGTSQITFTPAFTVSIPVVMKDYSPPVSELVEMVVVWNGGTGHIGVENGSVAALFPDPETGGVQPEDKADMWPIGPDALILPETVVAKALKTSDTTPKMIAINPESRLKGAASLRLREPGEIITPYKIDPTATGPINIPPGAILGTVMIAGAIALGVAGAPIGVVFIVVVGIGLIAAAAIQAVENAPNTATEIVSQIPPDPAIEAVLDSQLLHLLNQDLMAQENSSKKKLANTMGEVDVAGTPGGQDPCNFFWKHTDEGGAHWPSNWYITGKTDYVDELGKLRQIRLEFREHGTDHIKVLAHGTILKLREGDNVRYVGEVFTIIADEAVDGGQHAATAAALATNDLLRKYAEVVMGLPDLAIWFSDINRFVDAQGSPKYRCYFAHNPIFTEPFPFNRLHPHTWFNGWEKIREMPNYINIFFGGGGLYQKMLKELEKARELRAQWMAPAWRPAFA